MPGRCSQRPHWDCSDAMSEGALSTAALLKWVYESPPNRLMLLSSARAIAETPAASAAAATTLVTIENLLSMTVPCLNRKWISARRVLTSASRNAARFGDCGRIGGPVYEGVVANRYRGFHDISVLLP